MPRTISNDDLADGYDWCIAGGFAACPALAADVDVWIYGVDKDDIEKVRAGLLSRFPEIDEEPNPQRESPDAYLGAHYTLKVGRLDERHVLVTSATRIVDLVDGFDISTHSCGISSTGVFVRGAGWTPIWTRPVVLRVGGAATPLRELKLLKRYGFLYSQGIR